MHWLSRLLWAALAIVLFLFGALAVNQGEVALRFLVWETPQISVFWWLLMAFALGLGAGICALGIASVGLRLSRRRLRRRLDAAEQELERLRSAAPQD
ncbi:MAG: lipopolysaccharide assembly protein LapA domain-containing protein [Pseudomonadales bacterium]